MTISPTAHIDADDYEPAEPEPTHTRVGSVERMNVYRQRVEMGQAIFCEHDASEQVEPSYSTRSVFNRRDRSTVDFTIAMRRQAIELYRQGLKATAIGQQIEVPTSLIAGEIDRAKRRGELPYSTPVP